MIITHPSHYGLTLAAETSTSAIFSGTLSACRRMAFAHGLEVERYEGASLGSGGTAVANADRFNTCRFKGGGLILRGRDDYTLVLPLAAWLAD